MTLHFKIIGCLLLVLPLLTACSSSEPVRIGFVGGVSGRVADLGQAGRNGALMAIEEFNASGGLDGRTVELVVRDDAQDVEKGLSAIRELGESGIRVVIGPMTSSMAVKMVPESQKYNMVIIAPTVTTTQLSKKDDNFFRVLNSTEVYAKHTAEYSVKRTGLKKYAVAYDLSNAAYTESWLENFSKNITRLGGEVTKAVPFDASKTPSYNEIVKQLTASNPEAFLFISSAVDTARLSMAARQLAPDVPALVGAPWAATEVLMELGGSAVEGMVMPQFFNRYMNTASYLLFKEKFKARFNQEPGFASVAGYDAAWVVLDILKEHGPDADVKKAILAQKKFSGLQQPIVFDDYGDAQRPVFMTRIEKRRYVVVE